MSRPERSLSQEVLRAALWNSLLFPARFLVGLVASVVYYQQLSLAQVGVLFLLTSLATTIGLYADLGMERSLPRYLPEVEKQGGRAAVERFIRRVIRIKLAILAALIVALNVSAAPLTSYLAGEQRDEITRIEGRLAQLQGEPANATELASLRQQAAADRQVVGEIETRGRLFIVAISALLVLGALFDVYMQFLTAYFKQRAWNLINLATTLLQPVLVTAFILLGWQMGGVLLGTVITPVVSVLLAAWQVRRASLELGAAPEGGSVDPSLGRRFARFAGVSYLMQVTTWLYDTQFVIFLSAATLGLEQTAILGFAYKFAKDCLGYVWTPLTGVMTPLLARVQVRADPSTLREAHASLTRILWLLLVPAGVGLALLTPHLVRALYPKYVEASALVILLIFFTFGESLLSVPNNVLMVQERYAPVIVSRLVALLSIPLVYLLLPPFGALGVVLAVGLARVASRLVTLVYGVRELGLALPSRFLLRVVAASASFAAILSVMMRFWPPLDPAAAAAQKLPALLPLGALALVGAALYLLALRLLGGLDEAERRRLLALELPFKPLLSRVL